MLILNTIHAKRSENMNWREIAEYLETSAREQEFPQNTIAADTRTIPSLYKSGDSLSSITYIVKPYFIPLVHTTPEQCQAPSGENGG